MKLSVVVVNYKVPYFLEQALDAVFKACENITCEVFVVDNNSNDETVTLVETQFSQAKLIANTINVGFSTANNQAIKEAKGEYILLLNPDTVVSEDTFDKIVTFMDEHPDAGGLGVKMIDGTGHFLPESKRGFPAPDTAFYKTFGLSKIFPKSHRFNKYHLGFLDLNQIHKVDVLSGAFMLIRKKTLDQIGLLDETFFMYGEDIDLSYRIIKGGYQNYYFPETTIIHYKGESTKKGSLNYVKTFYNAMIIFTQKHFKGSSAGLFVLMLRAAIYLRAFMTVISNLTRQMHLAIVDSLLIFAALLLTKDIWEVVRFNDPTYYDKDSTLIYTSFALYVLTWVFSIFLRGGYYTRAGVKHIVTGALVGTVLISVCYAFLPVDLRTSRMLILSGTIITLAVSFFTRSIVSLFTHKTLFWAQQKEIRLLIVGDKEEAERVLFKMYQSGLNIDFIGTIAPPRVETKGTHLAYFNDLEATVELYSANEIVFCAKNISNETIIRSMEQIGEKITFKTVIENSDYIVGSNSKNRAGDSYCLGINYKLAEPISLRNKRLLDLLVASGLMFLLPALLLFIKNPLNLIKNLLDVLFGRKTFVGYKLISGEQCRLPILPVGVLNCVDYKMKTSNPETVAYFNFRYAKKYSSLTDILVVIRSLRHLGQR